MTVEITCDNVSVKLGDFLAVSDLTCVIPASSFCVIYGPNGAGKSTFLKLLQGVMPCSAGSVLLNKQEPNKFPAKDIAIVPQIKNFDRQFPARAIDLVATGLNRRWPWLLSTNAKQKCMQALEDVGIAELAERSLGKLSGGELQRVYVARLMARQASLVLLDEPATGMDVAAEKDLHRLLENYQAQTQATILMISHDWDTAQHHASHVLLLNHSMRWFGVTEDGPNEEAMRNTFGHVGHHHPIQHGVHDESCTHD